MTNKPDPDGTALAEEAAKQALEKGDPGTDEGRAEAIDNITRAYDLGKAEGDSGRGGRPSDGGFGLA